MIVKTYEEFLKYIDKISGGNNDESNKQKQIHENKETHKSEKN